MMAWTVFTNPVTLSFNAEMWMLLPLCAAVAVVYKTIRVRHLQNLPRELLLLLGYMAIGLVGLCVAMWAFQRYWP